MKTEDIIVLIFYIVAVTLLTICYKLYRHWKIKHDDAISSWTTESRLKDEQIIKLQKELDIYKENEKIVKIEKFVIEPQEFNCKFLMHDRFIEDAELFKKVCISEAARYITEEFERNPYLYRLSIEKSPIELNESVRIRFRLVPYQTESDWSYFDKEG